MSNNFFSQPSNIFERPSKSERKDIIAFENIIHKYSSNEENVNFFSILRKIAYNEATKIRKHIFESNEFNEIIIKNKNSENPKILIEIIRILGMIALRYNIKKDEYYEILKIHIKHRNIDIALQALIGCFEYKLELHDTKSFLEKRNQRKISSALDFIEKRHNIDFNKI